MVKKMQSKIVGFMLLHSDGDKEYYEPNLSENDISVIYSILDKYGDSNESIRGNLIITERED